MQDREEGLMSNLANDDQPLRFIVNMYNLHHLRV